MKDLRDMTVEQFREEHDRWMREFGEEYDKYEKEKDLMEKAYGKE